MVNRSCNHEDLAKYDPLGKATAKSFIEFRGGKVLQESEGEHKYAPDFLVEFPKGIICYIEPEVKQIFKLSLPYPTIHIPERKRKYLNLKHETHFMVISKLLDRFFLITHKVMAEAPTKKVFINAEGQYEDFVEIHLENALYAQWFAERWCIEKAKERQHFLP